MRSVDGSTGICILVKDIPEDLEMLFDEEPDCVLIFLLLVAEVVQLELLQLLQNTALFERFL